MHVTTRERTLIKRIACLGLALSVLASNAALAAAPATPSAAYAQQPASEFTAARLDRMCREYRAYFMGAGHPDLLMAKQCESYISGFLDSVIYARAFAKKQFYCPPKPVTPQTAADTLALWLSARGGQGESITAAVALLGALAAANPCPGENAPGATKK